MSSLDDMFELGTAKRRRNRYGSGGRKSSGIYGVGRGQSGNNGDMDEEESKVRSLEEIHGSMSTSKQRKAFRLLPGNKRKVVLEMPVAESSNMIEVVVHVIDCGKAKELTYDPANNIQSLLPT